MGHEASVTHTYRGDERREKEQKNLLRPSKVVLNCHLILWEGVHEDLWCILGAITGIRRDLLFKFKLVRNLEQTHLSIQTLSLTSPFYLIWPPL